MEITEDWLKEISDEQGLTHGQQVVLTNLTGGPPFVGKTLTDQQANFLMYCRGYRPGKIVRFWRGEHE